MGNKHEAQVQKDATNQAAAAQQAANQAQTQLNQESGNILPKYNDLYANPMSEEEKGSRYATAAGGFDAERGAANERVARTGNAAGLNEMGTKLALDKSSALGKTAADIGDTETQRRFDALKGMSGIYGTDSSLLGKRLDLPVQFTNIAQQAAANQPSIAGQLIGAGGQIGGSLIML